MTTMSRPSSPMPPSDGSSAGRGHAMGVDRTCPACKHDHAVGTTCRECPTCLETDPVLMAEQVFADLLPGGSEARAALDRHDHLMRLHGACHATCGMPSCRAPPR